MPLLDHTLSDIRSTMAPLRGAPSILRLCLAGLWLLSSYIDGVVAGGRPPNFLIILSDDQDVHLGSLDYMPLLKQYVADEGVTFPHHY